ncbi:MAG: ATP-dependent DNA helicase [Gammaproteobacteria bacterium]|nr:ATP-dependent DNA helicase [Gammaproteobacteria bacterium]
MKEVSISVGQLTELGRRGDINFRFSTRSTAQEGVAGHKKVQQSRPREYVAEHPVSYQAMCGGFNITVSGRLDGYGQFEGDYFLDEIKTVRVHPDEIPESILDGFWRQASLYGYMLCRELELDRLLIRLCFYHLDEKVEFTLERWVATDDLGQLFVDLLFLYAGGLNDQAAWEKTRRSSIDKLTFPYSDYRAGQRDMAVSVFKAVKSGGQLVLQAPTGIGKTMGTLFPAVHALDPETSKRLFYLSAKTSSQHLAEASAEDVARAGARLRVVTLTAKDKICFSPGEPCDPDHCVYARGYYDRIGGVLAALLDSQDQFNREAIEAGAIEHGVCPFELGLDLSKHCDLIISDYNYVFDPVVYLRRFFEAADVDSAALVDEAHNLVDRGRDMFSATIDKASFLALSKQLKRLPLHRRLKSVNQVFLNMRRESDQYEALGYYSSKKPPEKMLNALQRFCAAAEEELRREGGESWREALLETYFSALRFLRTAEGFGDDYVTLLQKGSKRQILLRLYCVDPSNRLREGFARLSSAVCFSATMEPHSYFQRMLGTNSDCDWYQIPSPFPPENLHVTVAGHVDTTYSARSESVPTIVNVVHAVIEAKRGNYLVFLPSYEYLDLVFDGFTSTHPGVDVIRQERNMQDDERMSFLASFDSDPVCGFAVMGGIFAEGIDLTGSRLIGAVVVGVGLPQIGIERDLIREHFPDRGFEYAYQYPGLIKVLQTAGRVIRSETDEGVVCLVDRRYLQHRYRELLPAHWQVQSVRSQEELELNLKGFWQGRQ